MCTTEPPDAQLTAACELSEHNPLEKYFFRSNSVWFDMISAPTEIALVSQQIIAGSVLPSLTSDVHDCIALQFS